MMFERTVNPVGYNIAMNSVSIDHSTCNKMCIPMVPITQFMQNSLKVSFLKSSHIWRSFMVKTTPALISLLMWRNLRVESDEERLSQWLIMQDSSSRLHGVRCKQHLYRHHSWLFKPKGKGLRVLKLKVHVQSIHLVCQAWNCQKKPYLGELQFHTAIVSHYGHELLKSTSQNSNWNKESYCC